MVLLSTCVWAALLAAPPTCAGCGAALPAGVSAVEVGSNSSAVVEACFAGAVPPQVSTGNSTAVLDRYYVGACGPGGWWAAWDSEVWGAGEYAVDAPAGATLALCQGGVPGGPGPPLGRTRAGYSFQEQVQLVVSAAVPATSVANLFAPVSGAASVSALLSCANVTAPAPSPWLPQLLLSAGAASVLSSGAGWAQALVPQSGAAAFASAVAASLQGANLSSSVAARAYNFSCSAAQLPGAQEAAVQLAHTGALLWSSFSSVPAPPAPAAPPSAELSALSLAGAVVGVAAATFGIVAGVIGITVTVCTFRMNRKDFLQRQKALVEPHAKTGGRVLRFHL